MSWIIKGLQYNNCEPFVNLEAKTQSQLFIHPDWGKYVSHKAERIISRHIQFPIVECKLKIKYEAFDVEWIGYNASSKDK